MDSRKNLDVVLEIKSGAMSAGSIGISSGGVSNKISGQIFFENNFRIGENPITIHRLILEQNHSCKTIPEELKLLEEFLNGFFELI